MAATEAQVQTEWQAVAALWKHQLTDAATFLTDQNTIVATLNHGQQYTTEVETQVLAARNRYDGLLSEAISAYEWVLREYVLALSTNDAPEQDAQSCLTRLYLYFISSGQVIQGRQINYGSPSAGASNVGTGVLNRLNVDQYGYMIENVHLEAKTLLVITDAGNGGQIQEEVAELRGQPAERDVLYLKGSGASNKENITALSCRSSQPYIQNASFSQTTPQVTTADQTPITALAGWQASDYTRIYARIGVTPGTEYYRDFPGDTIPVAIEFQDNGGHDAIWIQQYITTPGYLTGSGVAGADATGWYQGNQAVFDADIPMYLHVAVCRKSSADGTLAITFGNVTVNTSMSGLTNNVWTIVKILTSTNAWFKNFNATGSAGSAFKFKIQWSGQTTGAVRIDDVTIGQYSPCDGAWYALVGAAQRFIRFDSFTFSDALYGADSVFGYWIWSLFSRYLPGTPIAPASAPSCALAGAGAGNVDNGTHSYKVSFVDGNSIEGPVSAASSTVNVVDKTTNGKVSVTSIPTGPTGTTARKLYRSSAGNVAPWKLVTTIADDVTTSYTDNTADASLGASAPTIVMNLTDPS